MDTRVPHFIKRPEIPLVTGFGRMKPGRKWVRPLGLHEWLLWYTTRGECRVLHSGGEFISRTGDLVLITPLTPQNYGTIHLDQRWECWWTVFQPRASWKELLNWPQVSPGTMHLEPSDSDARRQIRKSLKQMHRFASTQSRRQQDFAMNALESTLLWCDLQNPRSPLQDTDARLRRAMEAVTHDLARKWTLAAVAGVIGVSEPHAVRLFRRNLNLSPLQYVEQRRIERACQLLRRTAHRISEISDELGFENPFYFSNRFKKHLGINPRSYREVSHLKGRN
jgi:AraC family transcriptional regulator of arabinose operon